MFKRTIAATAVLAVAGSSIVYAQQPIGTVPSLSRAIMVSPADFDAMVQAGKLVPVTAETMAAARRASLAAYLQNAAFVENYLYEHRELTALALLASLRPRPNDPNVRANANGNFNVTIVNSKGAQRTVQNLGRRTKMEQLAASIAASSNAAVQLQNYTALYKQLPNFFINGIITQNGLAIARPTAPSELQGAPLETILDALNSLTSQWATIVKYLPPPIHFPPVGCAAEVGANPTLPETYYGDEIPVPPPEPAYTATCNVPSPAGIFANFDFTNKGALTCVKDQGNRGTCGVFAATSAVEELIAINTGVHVNLSEQDFWETLTLELTSPPQLFEDGYDAGFALGNVLQANYQFAYENQWDSNPSWSQPNCLSCYEYVETCLNYPYTEPACSDSSPQAIEFCARLGLVDGPITCGFSAAILSQRSPYSIGPGTWVKYGDALSTGTTSVVGQVLNIWQPSGPTAAGAGPHPNLSVDTMILALSFNNTVMLGFEETDAFGGAPGGYVPVTAADLATDAGGHNVHVVGYVTNSDLAAKIPSAPPGSGGGYFIIKNSWGPCAGDAGYYYMPVDYVKARAQSIYVVSLQY